MFDSTCEGQSDFHASAFPASEINVAKIIRDLVTTFFICTVTFFLKNLMCFL